jgi:hypothetical protein
LEQDLELVLLCHSKLFLVWREYHLLLQGAYHVSLFLARTPHSFQRQHVVFADANFLPFAANHRIISFTLYTIGFVGFVMSLKKGYLKQQFGLFCWVHMTLLLIVVSRYAPRSAIVG